MSSRDALEQQRLLAQRRKKSGKSAEPAPEKSPIAEALEQPKEFPVRVNLYISEAQEERLRRLMFEHRKSKSEVVRLLIDAADDGAVAE